MDYPVSLRLFGSLARSFACKLFLTHTRFALVCACLDQPWFDTVLFIISRMLLTLINAFKAYIGGQNSDSNGAIFKKKFVNF